MSGCGGFAGRLFQVCLFFRIKGHASIPESGISFRLMLCQLLPVPMLCLWGTLFSAADNLMHDLHKNIHVSWLCRKSLYVTPEESSPVTVMKTYHPESLSQGEYFRLAYSLTRLHN